MSTIEDEVNHAPTQENDALTGIESALTGILAPGSSLHPKFLAVLDGAFASLFVILILLAFLTSGNLHIFALIFIELCLWASVKWYVCLCRDWDNVTESLYNTGL